MRSAIVSAYHDAYQNGAEREAWESFRRLMDSPEDTYGFWVDMESNPYRLMISVEDLNRAVQQSIGSEKNGDPITEIKSLELFRFEAPYNGFSGFDKEYFLDRARYELDSGR